MNKQHEALRLAAELDPMGGVESEAAAELRRLHEANAALVDALTLAVDSIGRFTGDEGSTNRDFEIYDTVVATLAKAEGKNHD